MPTTTLSSKGQVIIPKPVRDAHHWKPGQRLEVVETDNGILLKTAEPFPETVIADVAGCLPHTGKAKTIAEMKKAIAKGVKETFGDRG